MKLNYFNKLSLGFISLFFVLNTTIASSILTSSLRRFTPQTQVAVSAYGAKRFERLDVKNWNPKLQNDYRVQALDRDLYAQTLEIERREENIKRAKALHKTGKLKKNEIAALFEISESDI